MQEKCRVDSQFRNNASDSSMFQIDSSGEGSLLLFLLSSFFRDILSHVSWANGGPGKVRGINPIRIRTSEATWIAIDPIAS